MKQFIAKDMYRSFSGNSFHINRRRKTLAGFSKTPLLPTPCTVCLRWLCPVPSRTELSAVVFGQHVHPILILVIFFWGCVKDENYSSNPRTEEELKKIFVGKLQRFLQNSFRG
jgi:hypothetical protein